MREVWKTSNWYTCSSWNKKKMKKNCVRMYYKIFHFFLPILYKTQRARSQRHRRGGRPWMTAGPELETQWWTWSATLYVGYCILVGWCMQNKEQVSKTQFKKQLLNSIKGECLSKASSLPGKSEKALAWETEHTICPHFFDLNSQKIPISSKRHQCQQRRLNSSIKLWSPCFYFIIRVQYTGTVQSWLSQTN